MPSLGITKIPANPVKQMLDEGRAAVGGWITLCSAAAAEALAAVGWDWVAVDVQHSPVGFETAVECYRAIQLAGSVPMARIPHNDPVSIQRMLDAGAMGLIIPMINTADDAAYAVRNMRYATAGERSYGGSRLRTYVDGDYRAWSDRNVLCVVMIETIEAARNAEAILSVEGVDACFIGPTDLALSMGIELSDTGPGTEHEAAMMSVLEAGRKVGTPVGKHCFASEEVNQRIAQGFQFLALASDVRFMLKEAEAELKAVRAARDASGPLGQGALY